MSALLITLPNSLMYCSATRSWMASWPPGACVASATRLMPSAVAVATARIAAAWPSASLICCCARLRGLDRLLLLAFGGVDRGVALALGGQDDGALLALGAHLLFHRGQHVLRRRDVLDLVAQHLHAPRLGGLVELGDDRDVDVGALLERAVEVDLADLAAQRRLRELRDGEQVVLDAVGGALRVEDLEVEHAVDADLDVVAGDADLLRDVERRFLERVLVADDVDERHQDVEAGVERAGVPAEPLDDEGALLRDDDGRLGDAR